MRALNRKLLAAVVVGSMAVAGVSLAKEGKEGGEGHQPPAELLQKYDTNKNGQLDEVERQAMRADREKLRAEKLAKFDANKDGKLDDAERQALIKERSAEHFKALDTDGNGSLSLAEFQAGMARRMGHGRHGGGGR